MKSLAVTTAFILLSCLLAADAFNPCIHGVGRVSTSLYEYIPDGMSKEQWNKLKAKERAGGKNLGAYGPKGFRSRSLQSFQEDLEKGKGGHLLPMFNAKEKLKSGSIRQEDIPYMQRGGSWDNSDVKGAKKKEWSRTDKMYADKKAGAGLNLDWSGAKQRSGPQARMNPKSKKSAAPPKKKGMFGMF